MIQADDTLDIARPPAEVFAYVCELSHAPAWLEACVELSLASPGWRKGAELRYAFREGGSTGRMTGTLVEYEQDRRLRMEFADAKFGVAVEFGFSAAPGGTRVKHVIGIDVKGFAGKLMAPLIRKGNARQVKANLARLKQQVEGAGPRA